MIDVKITVSGLQEIMAQNNLMQHEFPAVQKRILQKSAEIWVNDAIKNVHVISGKTKSSIKITQVREDHADIQAGYGARAETRRPGNKPPPRKGTGSGPHDFTKHANDLTFRSMPKIINTEIDNMLRRHRVP